MSEDARQLEGAYPQCGVCGKSVAVAASGRPRMYCSKACKTKAWRIRAAILEGLQAVYVVSEVEPANLDYEDDHRVA